MIRVEETKDKEKKKKQRQYAFGSGCYGFTGWDLQKTISFSYFQHGLQTDCAPTSSPCFCIKLRFGRMFLGFVTLAQRKKKKKKRLWLIESLLWSWFSFTSLWFAGLPPLSTSSLLFLPSSISRQARVACVFV